MWLVLMINLSPALCVTNCFTLNNTYRYMWLLFMRSLLYAICVIKNLPLNKPWLCISMLFTQNWKPSPANCVTNHLGTNPIRTSIFIVLFIRNNRHRPEHFVSRPCWPHTHTRAHTRAHTRTHTHTNTCIRTQATYHPHGRVFLMCYSQSYEGTFCTINFSYV